ncbi:MAG TPA: protein kinase [Candidatus Sulfotelmatobacter sp.]|nr:protein kinase [Candidatus Sulfotelmatobacter sp.]
MSLTCGAKLGPYEILALLGAGGMGEVYRARDTRLERTVAIKVLNSSVIATAELKQRFEREARTISRLNHPHICTLHDVGHQDGTDFLVMEYLEGETLAQRLSKGALALSELLKIAIDILDGLEQAHRAGIVHRDLKPGNVMLTKGGAKLLDFGLAKPCAGGISAGAKSAPLLSVAMTMSSPSPQSPLTSSGALVGTMQYMAPEQFEGKEADARSDIFSFGSMLYEMSTGKRPFVGKTQIKVVSAILEDEPQPVSQVHPGLPSKIDHVVRTCLQKNPEDRYQSAHDIAVELKWISETAKEPVARKTRVPKLWIAAALLVGALVGVLSVHFLNTPPPVQVVALGVLPSPGITLNFSGLYGAPAISPDGTRVVVVGSDSSGTRMLLLRSLDRTTLTPLPGTEGASYPFWSPDGKNIGFFTSSALRIVDVAGRSVMDLCAIEQGRGGTWSSRGEIVFGTRTTGLFRVSVAGGTPVPLTKRTAREANHRFPTFLPDGDHLAYVVQSPLLAEVQVISLNDPHPAVLPGVISNVAFSQGRIFYVRPDGTLLAQRFDFKRLSLEPDLEVVAKPVGYDGQFNYAAFSVSPSGAIAYEEGTGSTANEFVWFDHRGREVGKLSIQGLNNNTSVRISPRGDQLLYIGAHGTRSDIWVAQLGRDIRTRISLENEGGAYGIWSPDGRRVAYQNGVGGDSIVVRTSDGLGQEQVITRMQGDVLARGWSADGNYIVIEHHAADPNSPGEIWVVPLKSDEPPHLLLRNVISFGTDLSPDGKWLAYTSEESGRLEVYVIPFHPLGTPANALASGRWQVSTEGGNQPRWSRVAKELFFANPSGTALYVTSIKAEGGKFESSNPSKLFDLPLHPAWDFYDIGRDGSIYMSRYIGRQGSALMMLLNWRPAEK